MKWIVTMCAIMALACSGIDPFSESESVDEATPPDVNEPTEAVASNDEQPSEAIEPLGEVAPEVVRICEGLDFEADEYILNVPDEGREAQVLSCQSQLMDMYDRLNELNPEINEGIYGDLAICIEAQPVGSRAACFQTFNEQFREKVQNLEPIQGLSAEDVSELQGAEPVVDFCVAMSNKMAGQGFDPDAIDLAPQCVASMGGLYQAAKMLNPNVDDVFEEGTRCIVASESPEQAQQCNEQLLSGLKPAL